MSKKQDVLRGEQNRDKHPDRRMKGSAGDPATRSQAKGDPADFQVPGSGKVGNDHNKAGRQEPTQRNEARRTPQSRHDRETLAGTHNVVEARTGGKGAGRGPRGAG